MSCVDLCIELNLHTLKVTATYASVILGLHDQEITRLLSILCEEEPGKSSEALPKM